MNPYRHFGWDSFDAGLAHRNACICTGQQNTARRGHTSMSRAGFEPTIPVFEPSKTIRVC